MIIFSWLMQIYQYLMNSKLDNTHIAIFCICISSKIHCTYVIKAKYKNSLQRKIFFGEFFYNYSNNLHVLHIIIKIEGKKYITVTWKQNWRKFHARNKIIPVCIGLNASSYPSICLLKSIIWKWSIKIRSW